MEKMIGIALEKKGLYHLIPTSSHVSGWGDPDCLRATCQYEVCCTCSQEEESLQCGHGKVAFPGEEMSYS